MIQNLNAKNFKSVAHLETSALMTSHPKGLTFSVKKPNVIVGPNGAGKSALLTALSMLTVSHLTGESSLDDHLVIARDVENYWSEHDWPRQYTYLPGLSAKTDDGPAIYFRPGHIPGNEDGIVHAMMTGYFEKARAYADLTENKSSGQQSQALLDRVLRLLESTEPALKHIYTNWRFGKAPKDMTKERHASDFHHHANALLKRFTAVPDTAMPVLLMDEPEQSLDARAEANLWNKIAQADCTRLQIVVATHSFYPLLHPKKFHLIESHAGYAQEVRGLLQAQEPEMRETKTLSKKQKTIP